MIQREIFSGSAILTFRIVALKNILPREVYSFVRCMHIAVQAYHRRHSIALGNRMQLVAIGRAHHLTFVKVHQNERTLHRTHHEWAEVLIEYQYPAIHLGNIKPIFGFFKATSVGSKQ